MTKPTDLRQAILNQAMREETSHQLAPDPVAPQATPSATTGVPNRQASRIGKVSVTGYFAPVVRRQLRKLAADSDTTIQALLGEALNDLFSKHGLPEIVEQE